MLKKTKKQKTEYTEYSAEIINHSSSQLASQLNNHQ